MERELLALAHETVVVSSARVRFREFRDRASEMFRSDDVILVTRDGAPAGFYLPWDTPEVPVEVRREVFLRLSEQIGTQLAEQGPQSNRSLTISLPAGVV